MNKKICSKCKIEYDTSFFSKNRSRGDGLADQCKICEAESCKAYRGRYPERVKETQRKSRAKNSETIIAYKRRWNKKPENMEKTRLRMQNKRKENPQFYADQSRRWYENNREKFNATALVLKDILRGKLERAENCSHCGRSNTIINAHHEDYSKPREIVWLCPSCHRYLHINGELPARSVEDVIEVVDAG